MSKFFSWPSWLSSAPNCTPPSADLRPRRVLGLTFDNQPLFEPANAGSSITFGGAGSGKTTSVMVPAVQALVADTNTAIFANDIKAEVAPQIAEMCIKQGRKFGVVDEFNQLGADYPHKLSLNPFGAATTENAHGLSHLPFILQNYSHALIAEPKGGPDRNLYWRESPRVWFLDLGCQILLKNNPAMLTPGRLATFLSDPNLWGQALELEAEDQRSELRTAALQVLDLRADNPEHYSQHLQAALSALHIFTFPPLSMAGQNATVTPEELIRDNWVVCFVNPARYAERLGPLFALYFLSLMEAQLTGQFGRAEYLLDEFCAAPLRSLVENIIVYRAYGARAHFIAQSKSDCIRKYGERETQTLMDNCTVHQFLKFNSIDEAEAVSKAMGEGLTITDSLNYNSDKLEFSGGFNTGKQRLFTGTELMALPADEQILYIANVGWVHCRKIRQNQIAPTCYDLGINPLESGRLEPDPIVTLPIAPGVGG